MDENQSPVEEVIDTPNETPESDPIQAVFDTDDDSTPSEVDETPTPESEEPETPAEGEQQPEEEQEAQPVDPKEEARRRYEERQQAREQRRNELMSFAQKKAEEIRSNPEDEYDQRLKDIEANDFQREVERYNERISANEDRLVSEFERVKANPDLQIFNPESEQFNEKAYLKAIKDFDAGYVQRDELGNMYGLKGSLFEHLTETAELLRGAEKSGAVQQVRATKQMRANADVKPAATPRETEKDPIMEVMLSD